MSKSGFRFECVRVVNARFSLVFTRGTLIDSHILLASGGAPTPVVAYQPVEETPPQVDDTPRRRSSRSRTKSPEPVGTTVVAQKPALSEVPEEPEEPVQPAQTTPIAQQAPPTDSSQMYEKIIDEMEVDEEHQHDDINEDELLAEPDDAEKPEPENITDQEPPAESQPQSEEKPDEESRGTKRRSDSPTKGNTPKKRQRLPPPNIEDFVNDEDEPELDETSLQLSWCKCTSPA